MIRRRCTLNEALRSLPPCPFPCRSSIRKKAEAGESAQPRARLCFWPLVICFGATALQFVTTGFGLWEDHKGRYDRSGRWVIATAVNIGWGLGPATMLSEVLIGFLFTFLAGGVVFNVLKEELSEERHDCFRPFASGGAACTALPVAAG